MFWIFGKKKQKEFKNALTSKEDIFWNWVVKNISSIKEIKTGQEPIYAMANQKLSKYKDGLIFEISENKIVISADGCKEYFEDVIKLCKAAPTKEDFTVIAFRPPTGFFSIEYRGFKVSHEDIYFDYNKNGVLYDLILYHPDYQNDQDSALLGAIFLLLDHDVGEFNVGTKIGAIEFLKLKDKKKLKPFAELKDILES